MLTLQLRFFARVREELDCAALELPWQAELATLDELQHALAQRGEAWRRVLAQDNLIRAVNHTVADGDTALQPGDEIAFYPPVTGG
ncbi:molybdopterin converting factor subunit 1 [Kineobactrum salinum]|uniref:Molybdopterin synthase sulfur carrier subunit n=1 Tax=Kineobactrum salinum TaxID=2708301 RepID=A0A6C0U4K8_9GAMM|nr:molybdopterin converting factor subunit 1 [Kineobactrum salinum]QIB67090.1 molybdopterin converting factor subunit 1 [Kineobactrum salinum]